MGRVCRAGRDRRTHRSGLRDPLLEQLPPFSRRVRRQRVGIDRIEPRAGGVVDSDLGKQRLEPEGSGFVGNDGDQERSDVVITQELREQAPDDHGGGRVALGTLVVSAADVRAGLLERWRSVLPAWNVAAEGLATLLHVQPLGGVLRRLDVGEGLEVVVRDGDPEPISQMAKRLDVQRLGLVRHVERLASLSEAPSLDGLREDDGRSVVRLGLTVGRVYGLDVVAVAGVSKQTDELLVRMLLDQRLQRWSRAEELSANRRPVLGRPSLQIAVADVLESRGQTTVFVGIDQGTPRLSPQHLDDLPARAREHAFELVDDPSVGSNRAVESLQIAADDETQISQALSLRHRQRADGLGLVHSPSPSSAQTRPGFSTNSRACR